MADFCGFLGVGRYVWGKMVFFFDGGAEFVYMGWMGWVFDGVHRSEKGDEKFFSKQNILFCWRKRSK